MRRICHLGNIRTIIYLAIFSFPLQYSFPLFAENFEDPAKFLKNTAPKATMSLKTVKGYKGNGMRISFDLREDHYVQIGTPFNINFDTVGEFSWYLKGNANGCLVEIKFVDADGSVFGKKLPLTGLSEGQWKKFTLHIKDCHYMWGGDNNIDEIKEFWIAFSRGLAKEAYVDIDEFEPSIKKAEELELEIGINQVGYHPADKKFFVVRVENAEKVTGNFTVHQSGKRVLSGKLLKSDFKDWSGLFLTGDFSSLEESGDYSISIEMKSPKGTFKKESPPFKIHTTVLSSETLQKELNYLRYQRCGIRCHKKDPVTGGYHDTLFDISKRMWSIPSLIYGIARYVEDGPFHPDDDHNQVPDDMEELTWGFQFIAELPEPDGTVSWGGIEADFKKFMTYEQFLSRLGPLKPEDDDLPRIKYKDKSIHSTTFNVIALIHSIIASHSGSATPQAKIVIDNAWEWINSHTLRASRDYGFYLWTATELYKLYKDKKYLQRVNEILPQLLELQTLDYSNFQNNACGDFYYSKSERVFRFQYKYISFNIAINLALINLLEIIPTYDPLWFDTYYASYVYGQNYLKGTANATPYRQIAVGLEPDENRFYKLNYFSGPEGKAASADNHGLNCDHLGKAYVAMKWGQYIEDLEMEEFADNQVNWVLGNNPLGYCMLMGAGTKNPLIMADYNGKPAVEGIIPNGIVGGKNEAPEWWGDGPSSGEDWLPHNAAYFAVLSTIETKPLVKGTIFSDGKPVSKAKIIFETKNASGKKVSYEFQSDTKGRFGPCELIPQKHYILTIAKDSEKILTEINLLSGAKKELNFDFRKVYSITVKKPDVMKRDEQNNITLKLSKNAVGKEYRIRVHGAKLGIPREGRIGAKMITIPVTPDGQKPFLLRFEIKDHPAAFKDIYFPAPI